MRRHASADTRHARVSSAVRGAATARVRRRRCSIHRVAAYVGPLGLGQGRKVRFDLFEDVGWALSPQAGARPPPGPELPGCAHLNAWMARWQVPKSEFWSFHDHAREYFSFVSRTPSVLPSVLVKVIGAFVVEFRTADSTKAQVNHLIVQENLFHGHSVSRMCDLKGAQRNRGGEDEGDTVLDENLFRFNDGYPLLLSESAKQQLTRALWNDTLFLSSINVMDYSLLVGFELRGAERREGEGEWTLVVGLVDYCRQFTWKEEAESRVKRATVIHPRLYKRRLLAASARPSRQPLAHNNPPLTAKRANSCGSPSLLHDRFQRLDACRDEFRVACSSGRNS